MNENLLFGFSVAIVGALVASVLDPDLLRIGFGAMLLIGGIPALVKSVRGFFVKRKAESV